MNMRMTGPFANIDLKNLSEAELEIVVQVIHKDFELKAGEKARLRRHRRQLKDYDKRVTILSSSNFNEKFCVICFQRFILLIVRKRCCYSCRHLMCSNCSIWIPVLKSYICKLCQKERNLRSMGCDWYYGLLKNRFQQDGSEVVAQSLYKNQGQWYVQLADSIITPDLLKKVKGAQISRYRQKIHARWEEMQEKLIRLDQSNINKTKKDDAWQYLVEEYKNHFKDILKEFSQFLYITLENYAAKVEDPSLNINEQVITTVYDEVELMIGYRINYMPEEMGSVVSDVESTASMFIGNQMEERLACALVNKIIQDHSLNELNNYDVKNMRNFGNDDKSSTISYLYLQRPYSNDLLNGPMSRRSSADTSSMVETEQSLEVEKNALMQYSSLPRIYYNEDINSILENNNDTDEVILSVGEIENIVRKSKGDRKSKKRIIKRYMNVPNGEPLKLQFQLDEISDLNVTWTKTYLGRTIILGNNSNTEISVLFNNNVKTFSLKIWQSTYNDAGLYSVLVSDKPIIEYSVEIIENKKPFVKPIFRLKMLNCNCRTGQIGEFTVEALGYPEPRVSFYHNNKLIIEQNDKYRIEYKEQISRYILRILSVDENDHGTYMCLASNSSGTCECTAQLQVTNVKFRFDKKLPRSSSSSNSSVEDENLIISQTNPIDIKDTQDGDLVDEPLDELVEIHKHLMYLEWQLDWFEEQATQNSVMSQNSIKNPVIKQNLLPKTVVAREIPDEFKIKDRPKFARLPKPAHSYSTENLDLIENKSLLSQNEAMKKGLYSLSNSNSNIARLKQLFEQPEAPPVQRNSSLTGRSPKPNARGSQSPFTREVRVSSIDYSN